jgi:hypothetical protein
LSRSGSSQITWRNQLGEATLTTTIAPAHTQSGLVDHLIVKTNDRSQRVDVDYYRSNYGGHTPLFSLGMHRTRYLYYIPPWSRFVTRHDFNNRYFKEHEMPHMRARDQAFNLRIRLGLPVTYPECYEPINDWERPKGMHRTTFDKIRTEIENRLQIYYRGMLVWIDSQCVQINDH